MTIIMKDKALLKSVGLRTNVNKKSARLDCREVFVKFIVPYTLQLRTV